MPFLKSENIIGKFRTLDAGDSHTDGSLATKKVVNRTVPLTHL